MTDTEAPPSREPDGWQALIVSERLAVDQGFQDAVLNSSLTQHSWELVMTASEFEIVGADDPAEAELVVDLDRLESVLPAIGQAESRRGATVGASADRGLLDRVLSVFRSGGSGEAHRAEAERLAEEYARRLRARLEETGRWETVVETAANESDTASPR